MDLTIKNIKEITMTALLPEHRGLEVSFKLWGIRRNIPSNPRAS